MFTYPFSALIAVDTQNLEVPKTTSEISMITRKMTQEIALA